MQQEVPEIEQELESVFDQELMDIDELQSKGINQADIIKLKQQGITTIKAVQMVTARTLLKIKGFTEARVEKIKDCAGKLIANGFINATELEQRRKISIGQINDSFENFYWEQGI